MNESTTAQEDSPVATDPRTRMLQAQVAPLSPSCAAAPHAASGLLLAALTAWG